MRSATHRRTVLLGPLPPAIGGVTTYMQYLLESPLNARYHYIPVRTMSRKHGTPGYHREKPILKMIRIGWDFLVYMSILMKSCPQIVHINTGLNSGDFWRDALYSAAAKILGRSVFLQIHGGRLDVFLGRKPPWIRSVILRIMSLPDRIGVLSRMQENPFQHFNLTDKVVLIPNMIRASDYARPPDLPERDEFSQKRKNVLFVASQFNKAKGVDELLASALRVSKKHTHVRFILVGGGKEKEKMEATCRRLGFDDHVVFTGFLSKAEIVKQLNHADLFILPSHREGFPYVILEAMSAGLPVIATPVGAIPELIQDGQNGYLVDIGDSKGLADRIDLLLRNGPLRKRMGEYNQMLIRRAYDIPCVTSRLAQCYDEILNRKNGAFRATGSYDEA